MAKRQGRTFESGGRLVFYSSKHSDWRKWLSGNFRTEEEIWVAFPLKDSG